MSSSSSFLESGGGSIMHHAYSRKQKSLGLLCSNFVSLYNRDGIDSVGLDDAARNLGVERRRIYDIVNVLESVGLLARKAKNRYSWIGFSGIPRSLDVLREEALRENAGGVMVERVARKVDDLDDDEDDKSLDHNGDCGEEKLNSSSSGKAKSDNRKEKSLGMLTENFVKLFLCSDVDTVSLDDAAKLLLGDIRDPSQMKTKVRRLYDIANVLSSLNLIEKTHHAETRKPAFRWLGLNGKPNAVTVAVPSSPEQSLKRSFGTDVTNVDFRKRPKLISSGDNQPIKMQTKNGDTNMAAQKQLQNSRGYVFGPFSPAGLAKKEESTADNGGKKDHNWEAMVSSFRPEYHNQALSDLFAHYLEAWKRWYAEIVQVSNSR